jgi:hypothetical protein
MLLETGCPTYPANQRGGGRVTHVPMSRCFVAGRHVGGLNATLAAKATFGIKVSF